LRTLLKCLAGIQPVSSGSMVFRGETLTPVPAYARVKCGLAQSPEGRQIFTNLTIEQNLRLGAYLFANDMVDRDMQYALAMFSILNEKLNLAAGGLSGGQQQMLAIARVLMARLAGLLLDEQNAFGAFRRRSRLCHGDGAYHHVRPINHCRRAYTLRLPGNITP